MTERSFGGRRGGEGRKGAGRRRRDVGGIGVGCCRGVGEVAAVGEEVATRFFGMFREKQNSGGAQ